MKTLKTYDIWKMIDENKDEMVGKRYVQVSGLLQNGFKLGDIAVVTEYCGITSLGSEKHSKVRLSWNGFEEWEELKEPVSFMEVLEQVSKSKTEVLITIKHSQLNTIYSKVPFGWIVNRLFRDFKNDKQIAKILQTSEFYIE